MKKNSFVLYCLVLMVTCTKEETSSRPYPRVETGEVTDITRTGAVFHGQITFSSTEILDRGFVWANNTDLTLESSDKISSGTAVGKGNFEAQVSRDLETGVKYYVRAYVKTDKYLVYGDIATFISLGSKAPQITSFIPTTASIGDTITIRGSNFSFKKGIDVVTFDNVRAFVTYAEDVILKVIVPAEINSTSSQLSISVYGNKGVAPSPFTLIPPQVVSVNKNTISLCDTLTLTIAHIPKDISNSLIFFNDKSNAPISLAGDKLKVKVPFLPPTTTSVSIKLKYGSLEIPFSTPLTFVQPKILSLNPASVGFLDTLVVSMANVPQCGLSLQIGNTTVKPMELTDNYFKVIIPSTITSSSIDIKMMMDSNLLFESTIPRALAINSFTQSAVTFDDVITIQGRGFHPDPNKNLVCFNCSSSYINEHYSGIQAQIISASPHALKVKVPEEYTSPSNGLANIGVYTLPSSQGYLYTSSSQNFTLKPPVINSISPTTITNGSTIIISGQNFNPNLNLNTLTISSNSRPVNIISATASQLTFQATSDALGATSSNSNDKYFSKDYQSTLSLNVSGQSTTSDFVQIHYKGPWTKMADFPGESRAGGLTFSFDKKIYYGLGRTNAFIYLSDFWEYDTSSGQWTRLSDFPGEARSVPATWISNNFGYMGFGIGAPVYLSDVWRFNPADKSWTRLADLPISNVQRSHSINYNNQAYVSAGGLRNFWRFNSDETWTRLNDLPYYMGGMVTTQNAMHALMQMGSGSDSFSFFNYDVINDSWSPSQAPSNFLDQYLSAYGKGYSYNPGYGGSFNVLNEGTSMWEGIYSPGIFNFTYSVNGFYADQKLYFLAFDLTNSAFLFYQFDPSLYPPQ